MTPYAVFCFFSLSDFMISVAAAPRWVPFRAMAT